MNNARIFVVSAQEIFRVGVIAIARNEPAFEVVGDAMKLHMAMRSIQDTRPDLIILDLHDCDLKNDLALLFRDTGAHAPSR